MSPVLKPHKALLALLLAIALAAGTAEAQDTRPNLVVVLNDDVSAVEYDFLTARDQETRNGARTPTLNMMRRRGVSFLTGWSMPICGPTRGSLVTGLYGQVTGWRTNQKPPGSLGDRFGTFGNLAKRAGYEVLIAGKWQMVGEPQSYGYDEACLWQADDDPSKPLSFFLDQYRAAGGDISPGNKPQSGQGSRYWFPFIVKNRQLVRTTRNDFGPDVMFDCAMDFITRMTLQNKKFLVYMPALMAHADYDFRIDNGNFNHYLPVPRRGAGGRFLGRERGPGSIKRNIEYQDYLMRKLLRHINSVNQTRNTITFFMGDNGTLGYGKKQFPSEKATRVPFVVYGPGRVRARGDSTELVSTNDIYATLKGLMRVRGIRDRRRPHSVDFSRYLLGMRNAVDRKWLYGLFDRSHWVRSASHIYDGNRDLWTCANRDERSCRKVSRPYGQREVGIVRNFRKIICLLERKRIVRTNQIAQPTQCTR